MDNIQDNFNNWLDRLHQEDMPPKSIIAFNFGIFEGEENYMLYLVGSKEYTADNDDWACNEDYLPKEKFFPLGNTSTNSNWEDVQNQVIFLIKNYLSKKTINTSFLKQANAITVGFDDGELIRVF